MQRLEVSGAVRPIYESLGVKRLIYLVYIIYCVQGIVLLSVMTIIVIIYTAHSVKFLEFSISIARFQALSSAQLRCLLLWVVAQHRMVF